MLNRKRKLLVTVRVSVAATIIIALTLLAVGMKQISLKTAAADTATVLVCSGNQPSFCVFSLSQNFSTAGGGTELFISGTNLTDLTESPYLDMNRDAAFDLGLPFNQSTNVEVAFKSDAPTEQVLFGARKGLYSTSYNLMWALDDGGVRFDYNNPLGQPNNNLYYMGTTITGRGLLFLKYNQLAYVMDLENSYNMVFYSNLTNSAPFTTPNNALLGSANGTGGSFDGQVYYMAVEDGAGKVQRQLVPVDAGQNIDGKIASRDGFYDLTSRSFLNNITAGSPTYVAGGASAHNRTITINGETCTNVKVVSYGTLSCEVPAYNGSLTSDTAVNVVVSLDGEQLTLAGGFVYKMNVAGGDDDESLMINSLTDNRATTHGGTQITITGQGLTDPSADDPYLSLDRNTAFNLGFPLTEKHDVEVVFWSDASDNQIVFGAREGLNKVSYNLMWALGDGTIRFDYGASGAQFIKTRTIPNQIIKFAKLGDKLFIDGTEVVNNLPTGEFTTPGNALIGSATGASGYFDGRIYSFKVWEDGTLVKDLIPVYRGQEIDGQMVLSDTLYDKVSQQFLYNILFIEPSYLFTENAIPEREVLIDGQKCTELTAVAENTLTCVTPTYTGSLEIAAVDVTVKVNEQTAILSDGFTYVDSSQDSWAVKIDRVEADRGGKDGGNMVNIFGDGFMRGSAVHFDGNSWVDLGLKLTNRHNVQICLQFDNEDDLTIFGARTSGGLPMWDGNAFNAYTLLRPEDTVGKVRLYYNNAVDVGHSGYVDFGGRDLDWHTIGKFGRSVLYDGAVVDRRLPVDYFITPVNAYLGTFSNNGDIQTDALIGSVSCLDIYDNTTPVMKLRPVTGGMTIDDTIIEADGFYDYVGGGVYYNDGDGDLEYVPTDMSIVATIDGQTCTELEIVSNTQLKCIVPAYEGVQSGDVPVEVGLTLFDQNQIVVDATSKNNGYVYLGEQLVSESPETELEVPNTGDIDKAQASAKQINTTIILVAIGMIIASGAVWISAEKWLK
ncbi:MAG: IPT/TIG domain-containing protein [Candidatus Nomurabacteria bacterium]|nr:IPT/TIG domain-containing protein [Candidatus Nomurabacteria bacterium]